MRESKSSLEMENFNNHDIMVKNIITIMATRVS
jgi:hypothetical protein